MFLNLETLTNTRPLFFSCACSAGWQGSIFKLKKLNNDLISTYGGCELNIDITIDTSPPRSSMEIRLADLGTTSRIASVEKCTFHS